MDFDEPYLDVLKDNLPLSHLYEKIGGQNRKPEEEYLNAPGWYKGDVHYEKEIEIIDIDRQPQAEYRQRDEGDWEMNKYLLLDSGTLTPQGLDNVRLEICEMKKGYHALHSLR